jgi:hypothetical protein
MSSSQSRAPRTLKGPRVAVNRIGRHVLIGLCAVLLIAPSEAAARGWLRRCRRPACCAKPSLCCAPCPSRVPPCVCPKEIADDLDPNDDINYFIVDVYDCECMAECDEPQRTVMPTDGFAEYPQLCEYSPPCEFLPAKLSSNRTPGKWVGLPAPKKYDLIPPVFEKVVGPAPQVLEQGYMRFELDDGSRRTAKFFLIYLAGHSHPTETHPHHPVPDCKPQMIAIGFQVGDKPPQGLKYDVGKEHVTENPHHPYVHHVHTGAVTYPIVVVEGQ